MSDEQLVRLKAALKEYAVLDDRVPEDVLLRIIRDAVVKPTSKLPLILQCHVPGTRMYRIYRTRTCDLTPEEQRLYESVDDFRSVRR